MQNSNRLTSISLIFFLLAAFSGVAIGGRLDLHLYSLSQQGSSAVETAKPAGVVMSKPEGGPGRVRVFVRFDGKFRLDTIEELGGRIWSVSGNVATVELPVGALLELERVDGVISVSAVKQFRPLLDAGVRAIGVIGTAASPRTVQTPPYDGLTGRNVIIGIIDTGIDFRHQDFRKKDGTTRIIGIWDQTSSGPGLPPDGFVYGAACSQADINNALGGNNTACPQDDDGNSYEPGHGTEIAGIAAGNGSATGNGVPAYTYAGVAPEADILFVKTDFTEDRIIDAMDYIGTMAGKAGKPYVINLSIGTQLGPHDGTTILEKKIEGLMGSVTISAGNWGDMGISAGGNLVNGSFQELKFNVPSYVPSTSEDYIVFDLWYNGLDSLAVEVKSPSGHLLRVAKGKEGKIDTPDGSIEIINALNGTDPLNGDNEVAITINDSAGIIPSEGEWIITLEGEDIREGGDFSTWLYESRLGTTRAVFSTADIKGSISVPATAKEAISTGSYVSKTGWTDVDGNSESLPDPPFETGGISAFSSSGPTRDGRIKPEVIAPGEAVTSSLSASVASRIDRTSIAADSVHRTNSGTSYAAPFVAGSIALLLEEDSRLGRKKIADTIRCASQKNNVFYGTTTLPDDTRPELGYGKLDISYALQLVRTGATLLSPPSGLAANVTETGDVQIAWNPDDGTLFSLERKTGTEPNFRNIQAGLEGAGYLDTQIMAGMVYYYRLKVSSELCGAVYSNVVKIVTPIDAPQKIYTNMISADRVILSWDIVEGASGYILERKEGDGQYARLVAANGNSYTDIMQAFGTIYAYKVRAYTNSTVSEDTSEEVFVTTAISGPARDNNSGCGFLFTRRQGTGKKKPNSGDYINMFIFGLPLLLVYLRRFCFLNLKIVLPERERSR